MNEEPIRNVGEEQFKIDSEDVFDPDLADRGANVANPHWLPGVTDPVTAVVGALKELMPTRADFLKPPNLEHTVRIYVFNDSMNREKCAPRSKPFLTTGIIFNSPPSSAMTTCC